MFAAKELLKDKKGQNLKTQMECLQEMLPGTNMNKQNDCQTSTCTFCFEFPHVVKGLCHLLPDATYVVAKFLQFAQELRCSSRPKYSFVTHRLLPQ